jgi:hypothetical protein
MLLQVAKESFRNNIDKMKFKLEHIGTLFAISPSGV